jgi:transposase
LKEGELVFTSKFNNLFGIPELVFTNKSSQHKNTLRLHCKKKTKREYCPKCATKSTTLYDKRTVEIKDIPIREKTVYLKNEKRRFFCKSCKKPFTEPIQGIIKGRRTTVRFRKHLFWCATHSDNLKIVQKKNAC